MAIRVPLPNVSRLEPSPLKCSFRLFLILVIPVCDTRSPNPDLSLRSWDVGGVVPRIGEVNKLDLNTSWYTSESIDGPGFGVTKCSHSTNH
jgi:hypothetical protein